MSKQALSAGTRLEDVASVNLPAAEVWVSGEFVREARIALWRDGTASWAEIVQASEEPVCNQLSRLYGSDPSLRPDEAVNRIAVQRSTLSSKERTALAGLMLELQKLQLSADLSATIFAPSRSVRLRVTNGMEEVEVRFNQPEPLAEGVAFSGEMAISQPAAAKWVAELLSVLKVDLGDTSEYEPD